MGWLVALAIIVLLAMLPLGVSAKYEAEGPLVRLIVGFWRKTVYPAPPKEKKTKEKPKKDPKPQTGAPAKQEKTGGKLTDFYPLLDTALTFLNDLRRKLRVDRLEVKLIMAGSDPCDLATNYGRAWAAVGNLWPQLERFLVIKKRDVQVECDFTADKTLIYVRIDMTLTLGRLLYLLVRYGVRALKQYLNITKGGAKV